MIMMRKTIYIKTDIKGLSKYLPVVWGLSVMSLFFMVLPKGLPERPLAKLIWPESNIFFICMRIYCGFKYVSP